LTFQTIVAASQEVRMTEASPSTGSPSRTALPAGPVWQAGLLAAAVLWLLTRRGPSGVRIWAILAVVFGALSALPAFSIDTSTARQLGLVLFHLLATVVVISVARQQLARWTREPA
jgi:peptidoglycan/LPS O-acetylase OafA/YrhL